MCLWKLQTTEKAKLGGILIILGMIFGVIRIVPQLKVLIILNEVVENKNQIF